MASATYNAFPKSDIDTTSLENDMCQVNLQDATSPKKCNDNANLLYEKNDEPVTDKVRRRNRANKTTLLDRVSKIISVYVSQKDQEEEVETWDSIGSLPPQYTNDYVFQRLFSLDKLRFSSASNKEGIPIDFDLHQINGLIFTDNGIFFTIVPHCYADDKFGGYMEDVGNYENCHFLYKYEIETKCLLYDDSNLMPLIDNRQSMMCFNNQVNQISMHLNGHKFVPHHVMYNNAQHLFMTGFIETDSASFQNIMVIATLDGIIVHYSKRYDNHRYGCLSGDADGSIFVGNPVFDSDAGLSGVSKIKANFSCKKYVITLGSLGKTQYTPLYVAGHSINEQTWVSSVRRDVSDKQNKDADDTTERRLIAFNCCCNADAIDDDNSKNNTASPSFKDLVNIRSWNFENLHPGSLVTLNGKLLVINQMEHTLNYIQFGGEMPDGKMPGPRVVRVTKADSDRSLLGLTSRGDNAFMWSKRAVYRFCFRKTNKSDNTNLEAVVAFK